jgi:hypothetical protein
MLQFTLKQRRIECFEYAVLHRSEDNDFVSMGIRGRIGVTLEDLVM